MLHTASATRGMVVAPHHLAAQSGIAVLREGGNALEATIAAAATIAVAYPHMNGIGGDGFWLIKQPGQPPIGIDACGAAAAAADPALYRRHGLSAIPGRGPLAANTVAGTLSGWSEALRIAADAGGRLPLTRLLEDAVALAESGVAVTASQSRLTAQKRVEMQAVPGFDELFAPGGRVPSVGERFRQPRLAATLRRVAREGPESFYRGALARTIAADLARAGSPLTEADLAAGRARRVVPLSCRLARARVFNLPPPTQGVASLLILAVFERLRARGLAVAGPEGFGYFHGLVEATKQAFVLRDRAIGDPAGMRIDPASLLSAARIDALAASVDPTRALPWPRSPIGGDTVWLGAADRAGRVVSFIQSVYWEFGSGLVLEESGVQWQNRGASFALDGEGPNVLAPHRRPFHTLNPALACLDDGRVLAYGAMGGEGQPQTQAAVFTRYVDFDVPLQAAITAPRWLLGRTWGAETTTLKLESRFPAELISSLAEAGHDVEIMGAFDDAMGHAGAVCLRPDGVLEGAADPRSDGLAAGW